MTLRVITQIPIDVGGVTVLRLPVTTRIFDAVMDARNIACVRLIMNRPKEYDIEQSRTFLVNDSPLEVPQGHYSHIRSLDRGDGVIVHVLEKVAP